MKTIISVLFFLLFSLNVFSQNILIAKDTAYVVKAVECSYKVSLYSEVNLISVETAEYPNYPPNEFDWRLSCKVLDYGEDPTYVLKRHVQSYLKMLKDTSGYFDLLQIWDLDGNLQYIKLTYPVRLLLPLNVVEEIEKDMRVHCKRKFTKINDEYSLQRIHYAIFGMSVPLSCILNLP
ncbi:hypothetical protein [Bacteroides finegoldii]|uniref:hypothetical protein n=1 Tax=Bacteroides finegoldii TaxID=338188 RepID=UPI00189EAB5D|nr:hypothetical protein [Bacteroides finegoldii]